MTQEVAQAASSPLGAVPSSPAISVPLVQQQAVGPVAPPQTQPVISFATHPWTRNVVAGVALIAAFLGGGKYYSPEEHEAEMARSTEISDLRSSVDLRFSKQDANIEKLLDAMKTFKSEQAKVSENTKEILRVSSKADSNERRVSEVGAKLNDLRTEYTVRARRHDRIIEGYCRRNPRNC